MLIRYYKYRDILKVYQVDKILERKIRGDETMFVLSKELPQDRNAFGVLGYLIIINKQVHNYQLEKLKHHLSQLNLKMEDTVIGDIIDGKEGSITFELAQKALKDETINFKKDIFFMLFALSYADNIIDENEKKFIEQVMRSIREDSINYEEIRTSAYNEMLELRESSNVLFKRPHPEIKSKYKLICIFQQLLAWVKNIFQHLKKKSVEEENDLEYKSAIENCAMIAAEDFQFIKPLYKSVLQSGTDCMEKLKRNTNSIYDQTEMGKEVEKIAKTFETIVYETVVKESKRAEEAFIQKERTINDFTISLVGRTKAGKSTLHSILTNQGMDKIGQGKQRTTRYNRVYQWNLLRLIDTPGIGSAEADGRTDDEIAESVLGESDVICVVIVDDSILKDVLDFIEKIAALNKPIIILLNHKDNIINDVKFRRFIKNPTDWYLNDGESNIEGHIKRIQKYADDRGFGNLVRIYPVFLLAAQMSSSDEYAEYAEMLWESSKIEEFIEQLKQWIVLGGSLKRSQTILDETISNFQYSKAQMINAQRPVNKQIEMLKKQKNIDIEKVEKAKAQSLEKIKIGLERRFTELAENEAWEFAERIYDNKVDEKEEWIIFLKEKEFEKDMQQIIEKGCDIFTEQIIEVITELYEEISFSLNVSMKLEGLHIPTKVDFRTITKSVSTVLTALGGVFVLVASWSTPIGIALTIVGLLASLGAGKISRKEVKRQKNIEKIHQQMKSNILEQMDIEIGHKMIEIELSMLDIVNETKSIYMNLIQSLESSMELSQELYEVYDQQITSLNYAYAWRILQFLNQQNEKKLSRVTQCEIKSVDRREKGIIRIECGRREVNTSILNEIIADKVIIK